MKRRIDVESIGASEAARRVAIYARVSTGRQAEHDLSIPDQIAQISTWSIARGFNAVAQYIEPGASATDDKRRLLPSASFYPKTGGHFSE